MHIKSDFLNTATHGKQAKRAIPMGRFGTALLATGLLCLPAVASAAECTTASSAAAVPGAQLVALASNATATATFCGGTAAYVTDAFLVADGGDIQLGTGNITPNGTQYDLGVFSDGDELVFYIYVRNTRDTFYTGPGVRNRDGLTHAAVTDFGNGKFRIGFEDILGGGDMDYDDINFMLETKGITSSASDLDRDGVSDAWDNCIAAPNADQRDSDGDDAGDVCDACVNDPDNDIDVDGACGDVDNCEEVSNSNQSDLDQDGAGDACDDDIDGDGVSNGGDNCAFKKNADQRDSDRDGVGDACDDDRDGDGVVDGEDACLPTAVGEVVNEEGCSIAQLCPAGSSSWKNHGAYVRCVAGASEALLQSGIITPAEKDAIVSAASRSAVGK